MKKLLNDFFDRYFHDEESLILLILLAVGLFLLVLIGEFLAPLIAAIVIAYLMQGLVNLLLHYGASARLAFFFVYTLFISLFAVMLLYLMPRAWDQLRLLANEIPKFLRDWQSTLMSLPENYPTLFSENQVETFIDGLGGEVGGFGQRILEYSLASLPNVFGWVISWCWCPYCVFVMKDKEDLVLWAGNFCHVTVR